MCVKLTIASQFLQTRHITLEQWDTSVEVSDHVFGVESIYPSIYPSIHPSIHPSIFFRLSRAGSRGQLPEQGHPDFPLPRHFIQLFWEYPKAFAGQLSNTVTPVCPGSSSGSPPGGTCQEHLPREASRGHLKQMLSHLSWLLAMWRSSGSTQNSSRVTELLTLSLRERPPPCGGTSFRPLVSGILFFLS